MHHTARLRPRLRRGRCADRPADRPPEVGDLPHLRRGRPGHHGATSSRPWPTPCRTIRGTQYFKAPDWLQALIAKGALGQKTGAGIFRKLGKDIQVLDLARQDYRPPTGEAAPEVVEILKIKNPAEKFGKLRASRAIRRRSSCGRCFRDLFHYSAYHLADIADTARDVDFAIRWGYGWTLGPVRDLAGRGLEAGRRLDRRGHRGRQGDEQRAVAGLGVRRPRRRACRRRQLQPGARTPSCRARRCPVYQRQRFPDPLLGEAFAPGETVFETDARAPVARRRRHRRAQLQDQDEHRQRRRAGRRAAGDRHRRAGLPGPGDLADRRSRSPPAPTSPARWRRCRPASIAEFEAMVANFQATSQRIKYALVPVVAAVRGLALGGGCEFQMHSARTVVALESYIGLVEAGVGLLPAGGGLKEIALRASAGRRSGRRRVRRPEAVLRDHRDGQGLGLGAGSQGTGLLRDADMVVFNAYELLYVAKQQARALAESGYRPPLPARQHPGRRRRRHRHLQDDAGQHAARAASSPSTTTRVATRIATVLCGGDVDRGSLVDEEWLLELRAQALRRAGADAEDPGAHRAHAQDRQAAAQLSQDENHDQANPGRLHRRRHPHPGRQGARAACSATPVPTTCWRTCCKAVVAQAPGIDPNAHRRRHHRLRHAGGRARHERGAHRRAAGRPARHRSPRRPSTASAPPACRPWRWRPTASASAKPT